MRNFAKLCQKIYNLHSNWQNYAEICIEICKRKLQPQVWIFQCRNPNLHPFRKCKLPHYISIQVLRAISTGDFALATWLPFYRLYSIFSSPRALTKCIVSRVLGSLCSNLCPLWSRRRSSTRKRRGTFSGNLTTQPLRLVRLRFVCNAAANF